MFSSQNLKNIENHFEDQKQGNNLLLLLENITLNYAPHRMMFSSHYLTRLFKGTEVNASRDTEALPKSCQANLH